MIDQLTTGGFSKILFMTTPNYRDKTVTLFVFHIFLIKKAYLQVLTIRYAS
ncbi:hypothetical protein F3D3_4284 [Fusibacter sp. 3D3]|nr:hypothetical protein F3D3_4284 [Fusibacter sp. 3D3]